MGMLIRPAKVHAAQDSYILTWVPQPELEYPFAQHTR